MNDPILKASPSYVYATQTFAHKSGSAFQSFHRPSLLGRLMTWLSR